MLPIKEFLANCYQGLTSRDRYAHREGSARRRGGSLACCLPQNGATSPELPGTRSAIRTESTHQERKTACAWDETGRADCAVTDALSPALRPPKGALSRRQQTACLSYCPTFQRAVPVIRSDLISHF